MEYCQQIQIEPSDPSVMGRVFEPKLTWNSSKDDMVNDFYRPALANCELYQRLSGYFSSTAFANVANEIIEFIESKGRMQIITSSQLSRVDKEFLEKSVTKKEELLSETILKELKNDPEGIKLEFSKLMGYMLANEVDGKPQMEMKIAIPTNGPGIYHQKVGIMRYRNGDKIAFSGSINETAMGWDKNFENLTVFCNWRDDTNNQGVIDSQRDFNDLWNNSNDNVCVIDLPDAVKKHLLEVRPESDEELRQVVRNIRKKLGRGDPEGVLPNNESGIQLHDYQNEAIKSWISNDCKGLLEMATGTGKTFTAFGCISEIQRHNERTITVIACPQKHLVEQWNSELKKWNHNSGDSGRIQFYTEIICNSDYKDWKTDLEQAMHDFIIPPLGYETTLVKHMVVFTTHDTLTSEELIGRVLKAQDAKKFLIVDEVHNITSDGAEKSFFDDFDFRLGLSATPVRHMDEEGTEKLSTYFHGIVFTLSLGDAISRGILCDYYYYPYYVRLTSDEMEVHQTLTKKIALIEAEKRKGTYKLDPGESNPYQSRADLIVNAAQKDEKLMEILYEKFNNQLKHTLIYCSNNPSPALPKNHPKQLERVQKILSDRSIDSKSITWEDKTKDRLQILQHMESSHLSCITAVKCLDEGVDVPSIETGIFMASSGNPKQYIQRRGRILRKSDVTGKKYASIYDILVVPPIVGDEFNASQRRLVARELLRHKEFAMIAKNRDTAIQKIREIMDIFRIDFDALDYDYINGMS